MKLKIQMQALKLVLGFPYLVRALHTGQLKWVNPSIRSPYILAPLALLVLAMVTAAKGNWSPLVMMAALYVLGFAVFKIEVETSE